jgi:hypothetical protein
MSRISKFFLGVFFLIILMVPVYWVSGKKAASEVSVIEGRVLEAPGKSYPTLKVALDYLKQGRPDKAAKLVWGLFTEGSLQRKFDSAATDQFPVRMPLIQFSKAIDRKIIDFSYSFSRENVIPADMTSDIFFDRDREALFFAPEVIDTASFEKIDQRIANYAEIARLYPHINLYLLFHETLSYSQANPLNEYFPNSDRGQSYAYFKESLGYQISIGEMLLPSMDMHLEDYYRTDHHWKTEGILKAYDIAYNLLSTNFADISEKLVISDPVSLPGVEFLGTLARKSLYPISGDEFKIFDANLPECKITDNGVEGVYDLRNDYLAGNYSLNPYTDYYGEFFGTQMGLLEYHCENTTNRNILIIGDSYARPLVALIASHYSHTYFVDLRQNKEFSLSNFISNHPIEDLLVIGDNQVAFLDPDQWSITP